MNEIRSKAHRHGWDCFKNSGGMTSAMENDRTLYQRIESVYKTAYATGYKNGRFDANMEALQAITDEQTSDDPKGN